MNVVERLLQVIHRVQRHREREVRRRAGRRHAPLQRCHARQVRPPVERDDLRDRRVLHLVLVLRSGTKFLKLLAKG